MVTQIRPVLAVQCRGAEIKDESFWQFPSLWRAARKTHKLNLLIGCLGSHRPGFYQTESECSYSKYQHTEAGEGEADTGSSVLGRGFREKCRNAQSSLEMWPQGGA